MSEKITKADYESRFVAQILKYAGEKFTDGSSIADYAKDAAKSYFSEYETDPTDEDNLPEQAADIDIGYWR